VGQRSGVSKFEASPGKTVPVLRPYLEKTHHIKVAQSVGSEFKFQYHQKKQKQKSHAVTAGGCAPVKFPSA
jgi:hypothetical protein